MAKLIEFKNQNSEILRGLLDEAESEKGVIFVHGFERTTVETKFKNIVDGLKGRVNLFRFDFSGCGLSDGKFDDMTVKKLMGELKTAIGAFKKACPQVKTVSLVSHSLAGCVVTKFLSESYLEISKAIFLAPAFNQKALMRFWFTISQKKKEGIEANWDNWQEYLSEEKFQADLQVKKRMTKEHELLNDYFVQNSEIDFQEYFDKIKLPSEDMLLVHGDTDDKVPFESNNRLPQGVKVTRVTGGDHDLQRPDMARQYLDEVISFLS